MFGKFYQVNFILTVIAAAIPLLNRNQSVLLQRELIPITFLLLFLFGLLLPSLVTFFVRQWFIYRLIFKWSNRRVKKIGLNNQSNEEHKFL